MQMTIRVPDEYKARIEEIASKTGLKKSDIARLAIRRFLEDFETGERREKPEAGARDLIGVVSSGVSDLGVKHGDHLLKLMRGKES